MGLSGLQGGYNTISSGAGTVASGLNYLPGAAGTIGSGVSTLGSALPYYSAGANLAGSSTVNPITSGEINQYMSPYIGDVVNATENQFNNQNAIQANQLTGSAIMGGNAFGGDRAGVAQGVLAGQQQAAEAPVIAGLYNTGYTNAAQQAMGEQGLQQSAAGLYGSLGSGVAGVGTGLGTLGTEYAGLGSLSGTLGSALGSLGTGEAGIGATTAGLGTSLGSLLLGTGTQQLGAGATAQSTEQAQLNAQYQQLLNQLGVTGLSFEAPIVEGAGSLSGGTSAGTTQSTPSIFSLLSDKRAKENIQKIGKLFDGQTVYRFNYKDDQTTRIGLIAQNVQREHPDAIHEIGGLKTVDYDKATKDAAARKHFARGGLAALRYDDGGSVDDTSDASINPMVGYDALSALFGGSDKANQAAANLLKLQGGGVASPYNQNSGMGPLGGNIFGGPPGPASVPNTQATLMQHIMRGSGPPQARAPAPVKDPPGLLSQLSGTGSAGSPGISGMYKQAQALQKLPGQVQQGLNSLGDLFGAKGAGASGPGPTDMTTIGPGALTSDAPMNISPDVAASSAADVPTAAAVGDIGAGATADIGAAADAGAAAADAGASAAGGLGDLLLLAAKGGRIDDSGMLQGYADAGTVVADDYTPDFSEAAPSQPSSGLAPPQPINIGSTAPIAHGESGQSGIALKDNPKLAKAADAISSVESGGNYQSVGPLVTSGAYSGDRAYGKYQVMGKNIPEWTGQVLGQPMTPKQFLADPDAQDAIFNAKFGSYMDKYGPSGAARAWFAGEGGMNNPNATDSLGTTVAQYERKFDKALGYDDSAPTGGLAPLRNASSANGAPITPAQALRSFQPDIGQAILAGIGGMFSGRGIIGGCITGGLQNIAEQRQQAREEATVEQRGQQLAQEAQHWQKQIENETTRTGIMQQQAQAEAAVRARAAATPIVIGERQTLYGPMKTYAVLGPDGAFLDPATHKPIDPNMLNGNTNQKLDAARLPPGTDQTTGIDPKTGRNEGYLTTLPSDQAGLIKGLADYRIDPNKVGYRQKTGLQAAVANYDGTFRDDIFPNIQATERAFNQGKQGDQIRFFNNSIQHITTLQRYATAMQNGDIQAMNSLRNAFQTQFGVAAPNTYDALKNVVGQEIIKSIVPGGGGEMERQEVAKKLAAASSPQQISALLEGYKELGGAQLRDLKVQYENGTYHKRNDFDDKLIPESKAYLDKVTASANATPSVAPAPPVAGAKLYQGKWYTRGPNGEAVPVQ